MVGKLELRRHDTDDRPRPTVDRDHPADDGRIARVPPLPQSVTDQRNRRPARAIFVLAELTSENRLNAEHRKEVAGDDAPFDALGVAAFGDQEAPAAYAADDGERMRPLAPVAQLRKGHAAVADAANTVGGM